MAIDNPLFISDMNVDSPYDQDNRSEGAGQIRAIKLALKRTFKWIDGEDNKRPTIPVGYIAMYSGKPENLTPGWAICDGQTVNGVITPDLRGRFIMGSDDTSAVGSTGGANKYNPARGISVNGHALTAAQIPKHRHIVNGPLLGDGASRPEYQPNYSSGVQRTGFPDLKHRSDKMPMTFEDGGQNQAHNHGLTGAEQDFRPAFYAVSYIMFVGMPTT